MKVDEFLGYYSIFYKNCINFDTGKLISFKKLREFFEYISGIDQNIERKVVEQLLYFCTFESKDSSNKEIDLIKLTFGNPESYDLFNKTSIGNYKALQAELEYLQDVSKGKGTIDREMLIGDTLLDTIDIVNELVPENKKSQIYKTYRWFGNTEIELPVLFKNMRGIVIDTNTDYEKFKFIFTEQVINIDFEPIQWTEEPVLLSYFIFLIKDNSLINTTKHWKIAELVFEPKANLRQLNTNNPTPKSYQIVNNILEPFLLLSKKSTVRK